MCRTLLLARSSIVSRSVSNSLSRDLRSLVFWLTIDCATGFGHCRMCAVVLLSCLHHGHAAVSLWPHQYSIFPVTQKPVVNLVVHHLCFIVMPFTTFCMVTQSISWMSIPQNLVLFPQYARATWPQVCSSSHCFISVLIFCFLARAPMVCWAGCVLQGLGPFVFFPSIFCHFIHGIIPSCFVATCQSWLVLVTLYVFAGPF